MTNNTVPAAGEAMPSLLQAITDYRKADEAFRAACKADDDEHLEEWNVKEGAEAVVLSYPCRTLDDVRAKALLILDDENVFDSVQNCHVDGVHVLTIFLKSILGEAQS